MRHMIPIWFFIGVLLALCGLLVLAAGINDYSGTSGHVVVMHQLHLPIWWGIVMTISGILTTLHFRPKS
jgi:hypothetical protein